MTKRKSIWLCVGLALAAVALGVAFRCSHENTIKVIFACSKYNPELDNEGKVHFVDPTETRTIDAYDRMGCLGWPGIERDGSYDRAQVESNVMAVAIQRQIDTNLVAKALSRLEIHSIDIRRPIFRLEVPGRNDIAEFVASEYLNALAELIFDRARYVFSFTNDMIEVEVHKDCQRLVGNDAAEDAARLDINSRLLAIRRGRDWWGNEMEKFLLVDCPDSIARKVHFPKMRPLQFMSGLELAAAAGVDTNRLSSQGVALTWRSPKAVSVDNCSLAVRSFQICSNQCYVSRGKLMDDRWIGYEQGIVESCASEIDVIDKVFSRMADMNLITAENCQRFCKELSIRRDGEMLIIMASNRRNRDLNYIVYKNVFCETVGYLSASTLRRLQLILLTGCQ